MKKLVSILSLILVSAALLAQTPTGGVTGSVVSRAGRLPIPGANLIIQKDGQTVATSSSASDGRFLVEALSDGVYQLTVTADGYKDLRVNVTVDNGFVKDMVFMTMTPDVQVESVDASNFTEFDMDDSGYNDNPTILFSSNDPYNSVAGYGFSSIRFKNRGYNSETQDVYFSGVRLNDAITGYSPYSLWTGLNEVTRSKETSTGLESSDYGSGGYNGSTNIFGNPSNVRKGLRASVLTNSAMYRLRLMLTYGSGPLDNGWSYAVSASARVGGNDWIKGVYYRSFAYYLGAEKKFGDGNTLALMHFATPGQRGAQNASTQEVYDLMGDNMYNSNWGYQNGKVRNSRVRKTFEPVTVLRYRYAPSANFESNTIFLWRTGFNGYTALDWYDASDPRPDYYRNLPSYSFANSTEGDDQSARYDYSYDDLSKKGQLMYEAWTERSSDYLMYQHLNWDRLYNVNYNSANGRSKYAQEQRHVDQNDINLVENIKWRINDYSVLSGGVNFKYNRTEYYKKIADLLGGEYFLNVDSFAERDFAINEAKIQNDLDYYIANGFKSEKITKGGKYGYDYFANVIKANLWAGYNLQKDNWDIKVSGNVGYESFYREGMMRKGLFAGTEDEVAQLNSKLPATQQLKAVIDADGNAVTSKGKSEIKHFLTGSAKAYLSRSFKGGHRVYANLGVFSDAPTFNEAFISPRTRNTIIGGLSNKFTYSADLNYQYSNKGYNVRLTAFYTKINNQSDVMSFYDDSQNSFTNFAMTGIDQQHLGIEFGFSVPLPVTGLSVEGVLSAGEYTYTSNPYMVQTIDNSAEVVRQITVTYWSKVPLYATYEDAAGMTQFDMDGDGNMIVKGYKKHYVPSTPQIAAQLGFKYNINYWFLELNAQCFAKSHLDMNPLYRTDFACKGCFDENGDLIYNEDVNKGGSAHFYYMTDQEEFKPVFLLNASVGKSWYINNNQLGFSLQVNNITNNRGVNTGGYEQTRLQNSSSKDVYYRFQSKYFYMSGINYMLNVYFRF